MATLFDIIKQNKEGNLSSIPVYKDGGSLNWDKMNINQRRSYIFNFLKGKGLNEIQSAAIVGNLEQENGKFDTKMTNSIGATGIAQWYKTRADALRSKGNHTHINTQLNYLLEELNGNKHWSTKAGGRDAFFKVKDLKTATQIFRKDFERPGEAEAHDNKRYKYALNVIGKNNEYTPYDNSPSGYEYNAEDSPYSKYDFSNQKLDYSQMNAQMESNQAFQKAMVEAMQSEASSKIALNQAQTLAIEREQAEKLALQEEEKKRVEQEQIQSVLDEKNKQREMLMEVGLQAIPEFIEKDTNVLNQIASSPMNFQFQGGFQQLVQGQEGGMFHKMYDNYKKTNIHTFKNKFISTYQRGGTVKEIYESQTGKDWSTAKSEGLTDGSYEGNMKLRSSLLNGASTSNTTPIQTQNNYSSSNTFTEAFKKARETLGKNNVFIYNDKKYGTNIASETFNPSNEVIKRYGLKREYLDTQNKQVTSPYTSKEVVKVEPEWKDWGDIRKRQSELNKMEDADKIIEYNKEKNPKEQYIIVDKKNSRVHVYKGGSLLSSYDAILGENKGDAQTVTKVIDGKTDWSKGNMFTGAGVFEISNVNKKNESYYGLPSFNLKNSNGIEVSTAFHGTPTKRRKSFNDGNKDNNRMSNGCINGQCEMLEEFVQKYNFKQGDKVYILPEDEGNRFEVEDGIPTLKVVDRSKYLEYVDSQGNTQKGQGVNTNSNTLNYKPIKFRYWSTVPQAGKDAAQELVYKKRQVMKDLKINSDVYNDLSLLVLGIMGQESGYGESARYSIKNNAPILVDTIKTLNGNNSSNSQGMTQIKIDSMNKETKDLLEKYGIDKKNVWNDGAKAGLATMLVLGKMFNDELKDTKILKDNKNMDYTDALMYIYQGKKKDLLNKTATPEKNNYINNVKKFQKNFELKQWM